MCRYFLFIMIERVLGQAGRVIKMEAEYLELWPYMWGQILPGLNRRSQWKWSSTCSPSSIAICLQGDKTIPLPSNVARVP